MKTGSLIVLSFIVIKFLVYPIAEYMNGLGEFKALEGFHNVHSNDPHDLPRIAARCLKRGGEWGCTKKLDGDCLQKKTAAYCCKRISKGEWIQDKECIGLENRMYQFIRTFKE